MFSQKRKNKEKQLGKGAKKKEKGDWEGGKREKKEKETMIGWGRGESG